MTRERPSLDTRAPAHARCDTGTEEREAVRERAGERMDTEAGVWRRALSIAVP